MSKLIENEVCDGVLPLATAGMKIGLLGGSFDPPHIGHRNISLAALRRLGLDQVWWLISPINPLKVTQPWPLKQRIAQCHLQANHPKIKITGFECQRDSFYTVDSLRYLKRRFSNTHFVWLMGADNLKTMHYWHQWHQIFSLMPMLIMDRPGYRFSALSARAPHFYKSKRLQSENLSQLPYAKSPAWGLMTLPLNDISSSSIRLKHQK